MANHPTQGNLHLPNDTQSPPQNRARQSSIMAPRTWTIAERHCLHILATHYPQSGGVDRAAIFNHVFNTNIAWDKLRDEYGGHRAGNRNRPNGQKPSRSLQWNDHVCRDEFNNGGFDQQQAADRAQILQQIQGAINTLGLAADPDLASINIVAGMTRADTNVAAPAAQQQTAPAATAGNTSGNAAASFSSTAATTTAGTDPAHGGRAWYHTREIFREGNEFVYRPNGRVDYNMPQPSQTWGRQVRFPDGITRQVEVCDVKSCPNVCGRRIRGG